MKRLILVCVLAVLLAGCSGVHLRYSVTDPNTGVVTEASYDRTGAEDIADANISLPNGVVLQFSKAKATGGEAVWLELIKRIPVPIVP